MDESRTHAARGRAGAWQRCGRAIRTLAAAAGLLALAGCASFFSGYGGRTGYSSSVVDYLYPGDTRFEPATEGVPEVRLPARVGLMFVPSRTDPLGLSAADKQALLEQVRKAFIAHDFIDRIEIVPETYLRPGGGFQNLEQVARLHGVDIVALVSYDQVLRTEESAASFLYWTIVGAYTIPATKNQVSTFVETSVFDVASRTLLLRAPGQDQRDAGSTAIRVGDVQRQLARAGFQAAVENMIANLDTSIADFNRKVKEEGQVRLVDRKSGRDWSKRSGGQGSVFPWELGILLLAAALSLRRR
ncbi:rhombotarget lipoprotein [Pseudoxanthomonas sangjuensis]|uniref:rhombotarget lipoprotein n=1 Tax=Pseudoxanthomonas sangjuensis TaxID=1503750 RepID=UPI001391C4C5|nr:rhombotarget lipoprotein [Pseudoxanthomonas sangjuensis]KAF1708262.1 rhombotarget lipoprotein [Pseudoxanthomonas sangjuensis]